MNYDQTTIDRIMCWYDLLQQMDYAHLIRASQPDILPVNPRSAGPMPVRHLQVRGDKVTSGTAALLCRQTIALLFQQSMFIFEATAAPQER